jgi:hypothetical protein
MPSREKRLTIPAALAVVLLVPGVLSCGGTPSYNCHCEFIGDAGPVPDGGALADAGPPAPCSGPDDPRLKDPMWFCGYV